jgi:2-polyprenyl-6-methoxyphenol hydroxylase-like FAD-dependent oxidoreductase
MAASNRSFQNPTPTKWSTLGHSNAPVLVAGAGPVGLITALQLANHGVKSILVERNFETTKWPKMDITNVRSMELMRRMGLERDLRGVG